MQTVMLMSSLATCFALTSSFTAAAQLPPPSANTETLASPVDVARPDEACGFLHTAEGARQHIDAVRSGARVPPQAQHPHHIVPRQSEQYLGTAPTVTADDLFLYEDSASLLISNFADGDLFDLMAEGANALIAERGDNFDFVGYFLDFEPDHLIGAAFYLPLENDVTGIGDLSPFGGGSTLFNLRPTFGVVGDQIEGFVMMWDVNSSFWEAGSGPGAAFTRLALGQEFEHRYGLFLDPLLDGRIMQGDDSYCGRSAHWNWAIDGQFSGMEIGEWQGTSPANFLGSLGFNLDIPGSVFSYSDLYLMGYVSAAEMDAGNSELRFMEGSDCYSPQFGTISNFDSSDIIASNGPRAPDVTGEQKDYRTGWVVFHLPGQLPNAAETTKLLGILNQHSADWSTSTLGRGVMDNTLPEPIITFSDLGGGSPGVNGTPSLMASGALTGGTPVQVDLVNGPPNELALAWLSGTSVPLPIFGGTIFANPFVSQFLRVTDGSGSFSQSASWPAGVPMGTDLYLQFLCQDLTVLSNITLSNAVFATTP